MTDAVDCAPAKPASVEYWRQTEADCAPSPKPATRGVAETVVSPVSPSRMAT